MRVFGRAIWVLVCFLWAVSCVWSAEAAENQAFKDAEQKFVDGFYQQAEADFGDWIQKSPGSPRIAEAILYQAEARYKLGNYDGALSLLSANERQSGALGDWYLLCRGEVLLAKGDYLKAEADFSLLIKSFPASPRRLAAVVNAAIAHMRLSQWPQVIELLGQPNGVFQQVASTNHASPDVIRGFLLLSEAQLAQNDMPAAELSLQSLSQSPLDATNNWQRQYLLCRVLLAEGRLDTALQNVTNLLVLAEATGQRSFQAQSLAFHAGLLERAGQNAEALAVYQTNLSSGTPTDQQRQALLKITELSLSLGKPAEAALVLQGFLAQFPTNSCADLALLTLGELRLHQFESSRLTNQVPVAVTNSPAATNFLGQAVLAFKDFPKQFPHSPLVGKAESNLGWCYWLDGDYTNSQGAFQQAVTLLGPSADQASALFKLGDAQFQLANYAGAIATYDTLVKRYADWPEVRTNLCEHALYQIVRASLEDKNLSSATNSLAKMLAEFPTGLYSDRAVLLTGQQMGQQDPEHARALFSDFARSATNSPLMSELQLAIARTYEGENKWDDAIDEYNAWLATFTNNPSVGRAEYLRAWAYYQAGHETNALVLFTNFVARFPTNQYAPFAQWWVADYLYRANNPEQAERNYKAVWENWPSSKLAYPARMMAGRTAILRQAWDAAPVYFRELINDPNCPPDLRAQALFAYGDTFLSQASNDKVADYREAFKTFDLICKNYPTNKIATLAWGQKAICVLQTARISQDYGPVTNDFQKVLDSPEADATARSIAEVGLGFTLEKIAETRSDPAKNELLRSAMAHYQRVFYGEGFLRVGEAPDPFWTRKAGIDIGRLAEQLQLREQAINVYRRLQEMFPPLRYEEKIKTLRAQG
jgi:TolA-binding protein